MTEEPARPETGSPEIRAPETGPPETAPSKIRASEIRASDAEREAVATLLNDAVGAGQLSLEEFSQRVDAAYAAKTRGELDRLVADLPAGQPGAAPMPVPAPVPTPPVGPAVHVPANPQWSVSLLGGLTRRGRWRVPERTTYLTLLGGVDLDLREAQLTAPVVQVQTIAVVGGVRVRVPRGVRVEVTGFSVLGGRRVRVDESAVGPHAPTVVIRAFLILGGLDVRNP
jgi:hypothetical protein